MSKERAKTARVPSPEGYVSKREFGRHVRSLRKARGLTQESLAAMSGLAADTIRRLESGSFSPSLDTLTKIGGGMKLRLSTLFESCELGERFVEREFDQRHLFLPVGDN